MNGLPGPSTTDTVTGGKTLELSDYDMVRKPHKIITDSSLKIKMTTRTLSTELCCPICLDLLTSTMTTKECLHRFCSDCITTALMRGNKECPTCRKKIVSKRSLRPDPNFDFLISKIWPDRKQYEEIQEAALKHFHQQNSVEALQKSIKEGLKAQAANRRIRIQGSYDYEKRKRRPKLASSSNGVGNATSSTSQSNGLENSNDGESNSNSPENVEMTEENINTTTTTTINNLESTTTTLNNNNNNNNNNTITTTTTIASAIESSASSASSNASSSGSSSSTTSDEALSELSDSDGDSSTASEDISTTNNTIDQNINPTIMDSINPQQQHQQQNNENAKPPSTSCSLKDKLNNWLKDPTSPLTPQEDPIEDSIASTSFSNILEAKLDEMRKKSEEIEVELIPAKSLQRRYASYLPNLRSNTPTINLTTTTTTNNNNGNSNNSSPATSSTTTNIGPLNLLLRPKYVKAPPNITMEHLGEYIFNSCQTNILEPSSLSDSNRANLKPEYFYILDHNNQVRKVFLHENLFTAFISSTFTNEHLMIFYETQPPDVNCSCLLSEIVSDEIFVRVNQNSMNISEDSTLMEISSIEEENNGHEISIKSKQELKGNQETTSSTIFDEQIQMDTDVHQQQQQQEELEDEENSNFTQ